MEIQSSEVQPGSTFPPYQVTKLASVVVLACYERDLFGRLQEDQTKTVETNDFLWRSQLQYRLQQDGASVEIQVTDVDDLFLKMSDACYTCVKI